MTPTPVRPLITWTVALLALALALLTGLALLAGPAARAAPTGAVCNGPSDRFPSSLDLPDGFAPEGIAVGRGPVAYLGNRENGDLYRLDLRTGEGEIFSEGPGTPAVGLDVDRRGRLWVAGGTGGGARVVDTRTGEVLASYDLATAPTFVNDVVITQGAAWLTDSQRPRLYRIPLDSPGQGLPEQEAVQTVPLTGDYEQVPDAFNANGIAPTPDRSALLVVQSVTGFLFRVDPATGEAVRVDLDGERLTNGDGLLTVGRTLYAVQNRDNQVAVVRLDPDGTTGELRRTITSPDFDVPTTVDRFGPRLYLPNARFGNPDAEEFSVTAVRAR